MLRQTIIEDVKFLQSNCGQLIAKLFESFNKEWRNLTAWRHRWTMLHSIFNCSSCIFLWWEEIAMVLPMLLFLYCATFRWLLCILIWTHHYALQDIILKEGVVSDSVQIPLEFFKDADFVFRDLLTTDLPATNISLLLCDSDKVVNRWNSIISFLKFTSQHEASQRIKSPTLALCLRDKVIEVAHSQVLSLLRHFEFCTNFLNHGESFLPICRLNLNRFLSRFHWIQNLLQRLRKTYMWLINL